MFMKLLWITYKLESTDKLNNGAVDFVSWKFDSIIVTLEPSPMSIKVDDDYLYIL